MADMRIREKVKIISEAAKHGESIPEKSKRAGLIVFLLIFGSGLIVLFALTIGLFMNGKPISAVVIFIIAALLTYSIFKMVTADDIGEL